MVESGPSSKTPDARYFVSHTTRYHYTEPVGLSRQHIRLCPRNLPWQTTSGFELSVRPEPETLTHTVDAFGNPMSSMSIEQGHSSLVVNVSYWATVTERPKVHEEETLPWEEARERLSYRAGRQTPHEDLWATRFLFESSRVRNKREIASWAAECFPEGAPLIQCVRSLSDRIHEEILFDPRATTVSTPVTEVFARRTGVCQDFAHLMLSALRSLGLAGRYVSGYLLTEPPPGESRLIGADASHAWVSVYCPDVGWVDIDPTNAMFAGKEHITIGWGRDYEDVSPLRGVLLGGGTHTVDISVTVVPAHEYEGLFRRAPWSSAPPEDSTR